MPVHGHFHGRLVGTDAPDLALAAVGGPGLVDCHQESVGPGVGITVLQDAEDVLEGSGRVVELHRLVGGRRRETERCSAEGSVGVVVQRAERSVGEDLGVGVDVANNLGVCRDLIAGDGHTYRGAGSQRDDARSD